MVVVFIGAGGVENQGDGSISGEITKIERGVASMSGVGSGRNIAGGIRTIGPGDFGTDCDGEGLGFETS